MKDYALRLVGLPCLEGALRIEEELKDTVRENHGSLQLGSLDKERQFLL